MENTHESEQEMNEFQTNIFSAVEGFLGKDFVVLFTDASWMLLVVLFVIV